MKCHVIVPQYTLLQEIINRKASQVSGDNLDSPVCVFNPLTADQKLHLEAKTCFKQVDHYLSR